MNSTNNYPCLHCARAVLNHHQAVDCDSCGGWQHRGCGNTGISKYMYAKLKKGEVNLQFICDRCSRQEQVSVMEPPVGESTRLSLAADITGEERSLRVAEYDQTTEMDVGSDTDDVIDPVEPASLYLTPPRPPVILEESSLIEDVPANNEVATEPVPLFTVVVGGSTKGHDLLVESTGYSYTKKNQRGATTNWWCSVRNKQVRCPAAVSQKGDQFRRGSRDHVHQATPGLLDKFQLTRQVKDAAATDVFKSAPVIIEEKICESGVEFNLLQPDLLARVANRFRQKGRPDEPRGVDFQVLMNYGEAEFLNIQLALVREKKLKKTQRKSSRSIQARIFEQWELYHTGALSADKLLKKLYSVYGPQ